MDYQASPEQRQSWFEAAQSYALEHAQLDHDLRVFRPDLEKLLVGAKIVSIKFSEEEPHYTHLTPTHFIELDNGLRIHLGVGLPYEDSGDLRFQTSSPELLAKLVSRMKRET